MNKQETNFDIVVIGAGPAGMMAAIWAAKKGARVALVEKKDRAGIKLLMTGNGRCNLSQAEFDINELIKKYGKNGRFLYSAFSKFGPREVIDFFESEGIKTKIEKGGKVFPKSDQSKDVVDVLLKMLKGNGVNFFYESDIVEIVCSSQEHKSKDLISKKITKIITRKRIISADKFIFATGGKSYPNTGSTGDGYIWAKELGHTIIEPKPALVPMKTKEVYKDLQGVSVHGCKISMEENGKNIAKETGDIIFSHFGLSGPAILNLSREIVNVARDLDNIKISIDFKPHLTISQLDEIIRKDLERNSSKNLGNCLVDLFSSKLREFLLNYSGIEITKHAAKVSREERRKLVEIFKRFEFTMHSIDGFEKAMVTEGGIATREINSATMKSKIIDNLYFAGEIINVSGPTGGYNLQICWATGYVAGNSAAA